MGNRKKRPDSRPLGRGVRLGDRYLLIRLIGTGGMGRIHLARDEALGREVAIKILRESFAKETDHVRRFRREAQAAAAIGHPNIVQVYDVGRTEDGRYFIAMEALSGHDLRAELQTKTRLRLDVAIDIAGQVLFALSAAHRAGIVHRDLKPGNIFLARRPITSWTDFEASGTGALPQLTVKLLDFGISRFVDPPPGEEQTADGTVLGSARYMAPEQFAGRPDIDGRADLYSLGVILYEALTGQSPFGEGDVFSVINPLFQRTIPPAHELVEGLPEGLSAVLARALAVDVEQRFQFAEAFIDALRPFRLATLPPVDEDDWDEHQPTDVFRRYQPQEPEEPEEITDVHPSSASAAVALRTRSASASASALPTDWEQEVTDPNPDLLDDVE